MLGETLPHCLSDSPRRLFQPLLVVSARADFFSKGDRAVDLRRRRPLRFLLAELVARHTRGPRRPMTVAEAFSAAWPGQRVAEAIVMGRVQNAVCALRRMGLRHVLLSRAGGYLLDPRALVVVDDDLGLVSMEYAKAS